VRPGDDELAAALAAALAVLMLFVLALAYGVT
jgi:hypothetical protein